MVFRSFAGDGGAMLFKTVVLRKDYTPLRFLYTFAIRIQI
jgi:hypothetical protein